MKSKAGRTNGPEQGFTLVEQVIALAVVAIVLVPIAGMVYSGMAGAASSRHVGDATGLASAQLAHAGAIPYQDLGFYGDQPGVVSTYQGQQTVVLAATTPSGGTPQVVPVQSTTVGTVNYTVDTAVVWADAAGPSGPYPQAYKRVYAVVSWHEGTGTEQVTENTLVYPGSIGPYTGPGSQSPDNPVTSVSDPAGLGASVPSVPGSPTDPGATEVDLSWSAPGSDPGYYVVEWATAPNVLPAAGTSGTGGPGSSGMFQSSPHEPGTATVFAVQSLTSSTQYWFEVVAWTSTGTSWAVSTSQVTATTDPPPSDPPCTMSGLTVTGASSGNTGKTYLSRSGSMSENLDLVVGSTGSCTGATVTVVGAAPGGGTDPGSPYALAGSGSQWTATVPSAGQSTWPTGQHTFTVELNATPVAPPLAQSLVVCSYIAPGQRSGAQNQC